MGVVVQCVPNFSEGRNNLTVEAIVKAASEASAARVIDYSSDPDHNRMVVTLLGEPAEIRCAVLAASERAVELIDMRSHSGAHPRIGAVDVIPLVPLRGITMQECVDLSYEIGEDLAERLRVPVYFYEYSARSSTRRNLAEIRRGGYERLRDEGMTGDRAPDVGPHSIHPTAGATAVGARGPLIAYNVNLDTTDMEICQSIVQKIRTEKKHEGVKAIAVWLATQSRVQVSMNLTQPELTPLKEIYDFVKSEADKHGVEIQESEIIGALPASALDGVGKAAIKAWRLKESQILDAWL